jgi:drug/metabolite transporter (DMT)-like permease
VRGQWLVVVLSLGAAFAFAASNLLKHLSAGRVPDAQSLQPTQVGDFIRATLSQPLWLGGIACDIIAVGLQVLALHLGSLSVVQPLLITGLLFALILRPRIEHHRISRRQLSWAVVLTAALAGFLLLATSGQPAAPETADRLPAIVAGVLGTVLAAGCIALGRRPRAKGRSAALLGVAVGVIDAAIAALLKALTDITARAPLDVLISWQLFTTIALGAGVLLLNQLAFQAGPISASLPAIATINPLLSIAVGVLVYDEHISRGPGGGTLLIILLVVLCAAVVQLTRTADTSERAGHSATPTSDRRR